MDRLSELPVGSVCTVGRIEGGAGSVKRFVQFGLTEGTVIRVLVKSLCGDPTAYLVRGSVLAIRRENAKEIFVE